MESAVGRPAGHMLIRSPYYQSVKPQLRTRNGYLPERNVPVHGKRHGIHELGSVRNEGEKGQSEEFLIDGNPFENNIDDIDQNFCPSATFLG